MKVNLKMVLNKVKESIHIPMVIIMKENGIMERNMVEEFMFGYMIKKRKIKKFMMDNFNMILCMVEDSLEMILEKQH